MPDTFKFIFIEVELNCNVVLITIIQQSDSVIDIYIFFFIFFSFMVYHKILNNVFLCCTVGPCCFSILYLPVCNPKLSLLPSPIHFPLGPGTFKVFHI